jgi:hypothetical protein
LDLVFVADQDLRDVLWPSLELDRGDGTKFLQTPSL